MKDWNEAHLAGVNIRELADNAPPYTPKPNGQKAGPKSLIVSSGEFVAGYVAPRYAIGGMVQQNRLYSLTGKTGDGKTALQLDLAYRLATGSALGKRKVKECRVLYLAGENPDDVRARWIAMSDIVGFDANTIRVHFVEGVFSISKMLKRVARRPRR